MSEQPSTERLQTELRQISAKLDTYPFRQDNKRIYALLNSEEGKQLSRELREHLERRTMQNVLDAINANSEVERLFLREHEIEVILRRQHPDHAIGATLQEPPGRLFTS